MAVAQLVRAPPCGGGGRRFETAQPPQMEIPNFTLEVIPTTPITLAELMKLEEIKIPIYKTSINEFYNALTVLYQSGQVSKIDGSIDVCISAGYRSPLVNSNLHEAGVVVPKIMPKDKRARGFAIEKLAEGVRKGKITDDGFLLPNGFLYPVKNLFATIDPRGSESDNLSLLVKQIHYKYEDSHKPVKLNVIVILGEENELIKRGKKFEDEVLNTSTFSQTK